jgi:hypothetical protein
VLNQYAFSNATRVSGIAFDVKTGRVVLAVDGRWHRFDSSNPAVPVLEREVPRLGSRTIAAPGGGTLYYGSGKDVIAWDLITGHVRSLATLPRTVENVAVDRNGVVFAAGGPDVYQVKSARPGDFKPEIPSRTDQP